MQCIVVAQKRFSLAQRKFFTRIACYVCSSQVYHCLTRLLPAHSGFCALSKICRWENGCGGPFGALSEMCDKARSITYFTRIALCCRILAVVGPLPIGRRLYVNHQGGSTYRATTREFPAPQNGNTVV